MPLLPRRAPGDQRYLYLVAALIGAIAIVAALVIREADDHSKASAPSSTPDTSTAAASLPPSSETSTAIPCNGLRSEDAAGQPISAGFLDRVRAVHAAACAADTDALLAGIHEDDRAELAPLFRYRPGLADLVAVLESTPLAGQNGLVYCVPEKGRAGFSRDVPGVSAVWSYAPYVLEC